LLHVRGFAAPETKAAVERARMLIEQAKEVNEAPEGPTAVILCSFWLLGVELLGV